MHFNYSNTKDLVIVNFDSEQRDGGVGTGVLYLKEAYIFFQNNGEISLPNC
jgi:hypothetical protein